RASGGARLRERFVPEREDPGLGVAASRIEALGRTHRAQEGLRRELLGIVRRGDVVAEVPVDPGPELVVPLLARGGGGGGGGSWSAGRGRIRGHSTLIRLTAPAVTARVRQRRQGR